MANRRFEMYQYRQVLVRMRQGDSNREIASSRLMGRKKASALRSLAEAEGWLDGPLPDDETLAGRLGGPAPRLSSASLVEPFRDDVTKWRSEGIQGTTIHRVLKEVHRFEGSYSSVQRFLQKLGDREPAAIVILDFAPGDTAQVDFGRGPQVPGPCGEPESTWVFVMTLAWSRHQYAELVLDQKVTTWLGCHRRAFEFFGGVPSRVRIDNPKCAITRACYHEPGVQRAYGEQAEGYGFKIDPCPPRDPKKKGRVESGVKYVKRSFMPLRRFRDLADANQQLQEWVLGEAGNRIHGTTQERPLVRFTQTERPLLRCLPDIAPEPAEWVRVKVHTDGHVRHEKCRYSVPYRLIGRRLWLKATATMVGLFESCSLVASHSRLIRPGERSTVDDHLPPGALAFKRQDPQWCREQADQIGRCCSALIGELFRDRILDNLRAAQGVIRLGKSYGPHAWRRPVNAPWPSALPAIDLSRPSSRRAWTRSPTRRRAGIGLLRCTPAAAVSPAIPAPFSSTEERIMNPMPELAPLLKRLRLSGILDSLEERNREAIEKKLAFTEFLALLIQDEVARRDQKKFSLRLRRAGFQSHKTLESFDFDFNRRIDQALIRELATCRFISEHANVLIAGPCGTGKSHISQALGHCAVRAGFDVLFTNHSKMLAALHAARATGTFERRFLALAKVDLLIVDDFALKPMISPHDEDFHDLIAERYERCATVVSSNLDFSEWGEVFPNRLLGAATLDRMRDGAYRVVLDGSSYRKPRPLPKGSKTKEVKT